MPIKIETERFNAYAKAYYDVAAQMPEPPMEEPVAGAASQKARRTIGTRTARYGKSKSTPQGDAAMRDKSNRTSGKGY